MASEEGIIESLKKLRRVTLDTEEDARDPDTAALSIEARFAIGAVLMLIASTTILPN